MTIYLYDISWRRCTYKWIDRIVCYHYQQKACVPKRSVVTVTMISTHYIIWWLLYIHLFRWNHCDVDASQFRGIGWSVCYRSSFASECSGVLSTLSHAVSFGCASYYRVFSKTTNCINTIVYLPWRDAVKTPLWRTIVNLINIQISNVHYCIFCKRVESLKNAADWSLEI